MTPAPSSTPAARRLPVVAHGGSWLPSRHELTAFGIQLVIVLALVACMGIAWH
ncbi:hypothetical protein GCM10010464_25930 [Pseudonocardia yunnanensis]|uniref:Uncharacterized protein n=1 Tax=Pseudonocardia yunnanensis TaxID=58107 RepID=A0ABW4F108_9PSEU